MTKTSGLQISRVLHAGYVFESPIAKIIFDPILENPFSQNCFAYPPVQFDYEKITKLKFEAIFISHYHDDHCSFESLEKLDRRTPLYMYCLFPEMFLLLGQLGFIHVYSLQLNKPVVIQDIVVIPRRALDADVDCLFEISYADIKVLNVVDSWIDHETIDLLAQSKWDLILWPFQTLRELEVLSPRRASPAVSELPHEWAEQLRILKPKYLVPSSCQFIHEDWSWYNTALFPVTYAQFKKWVSAEVPDTQVIRMDPSQSVYLNADSCIRFEKNLDWVRCDKVSTVDYHYVPKMKVPTTAEVAQHFPQVTTEQQRRSEHFCTNELLEIFSSLSVLDSIFFKTKRIWELNIYDQVGTKTQFFYSLCNQEIKLLSNPESPVAWITEISTAKLFSALEFGESMSSLYVRINDAIFSPEIETLFAETGQLTDQLTGCLIDPLMRCLYEGKFGTYQKAQLASMNAEKLRLNEKK